MAVLLNGRDRIMDHLQDMAMHDTALFPDSSEIDVVLTAHADANTFTDWAEIVDTQGSPVSLSSKFASYGGHITAMEVEETNQASTLYIIELAYGAAKTVITRFRFVSDTNQKPVIGQARVRSCHIPAGETIYYRAMCETAAAKTANVAFRYFLED